MKYYAVTDDPTELMHYGIKGMKWGIIRTDAQLGHPKKPKVTKPRSPAYQKASFKLSSAMQRGIAKAQKSWNVYNSPANKQLRAERRDYNKAVRDYKRGERKFEKHVQLARQGRLKYKGISDSEVQRITDRLALERNARSLSGAENPSFVRRIGTSIGNGVVQGVGQGVANSVSERFSRKSKLKTQRMMAEQSNKLRNKQAKREFDQDMREAKIRDKYQERRDIAREQAKKSRDLREAYETMAQEQGVHVQKHFIRSGDAKRRKLLYDMTQQREKETYDQDTARKLEYKKEELKLTAKYKKDKKNKKENGKQQTPEGNANAATVTPHASPARSNNGKTANSFPVSDRNYSKSDIMNRASAIRKGQNYTNSRFNNFVVQNNQAIDNALEEEKQQSSNDYWSRIHDFNTATERANERKREQEEARRSRELKEQGWRDRENRLAYRQAVHDYAAEVAYNKRKNRRSANPGTRISRVVRYGNTYSTETPLFVDEEHQWRRRTRGRR